MTWANTLARGAVEIAKALLDKMGEMPGWSYFTALFIILAIWAWRRKR